MTDLKEKIISAFYNKQTGLTRNVAKLKKKNPELFGIPGDTIRSVLDNYTQEYQKSKPFREVKNFSSYKAEYIGEVIHCDLMFIKSPRNTNQSITIDNSKYILICVDTYSRFLWAYPIESKSSKEVTECLKQMVNDIRNLFYEGYNGLKIKILTDAGKEFNGNQINKMKNVKHVISKNQHGAVIAESYIYKIREKVRYLDDGRKKKISLNDLKQIVMNLNDDGANEIFFEGKIPNDKLKVKEYAVNKYNQGDFVRIINIFKFNETFVKKSSMNNYTDKIFIITFIDFNKEQNIYRYTIASLDGKFSSERLFYEEELVKVPFSYGDNIDIDANSNFTKEEIKMYNLVLNNI